MKSKKFTRAYTQPRVQMIRKAADQVNREQVSRSSKVQLKQGGQQGGRKAQSNEQRVDCYTGITKSGRHTYMNNQWIKQT